MSEITLTLPDNLAQEAKESGLLKPEFIASMLRAEIRRRRVNKLFAAADRLADLDEPLTDEEIAAEIAAAKNEVFDFLNDSEEDIYSLTDGNPFLTDNAD